MAINITPNTLERVQKIRIEKNNPNLKLRILVDGGGCSGFQYIFKWDEIVTAKDMIYQNAVLIDDISLPFLENATIDFVTNLMGQDFKIINPNATSGCGCGTSFSVS